MVGSVSKFVLEAFDLDALDLFGLGSNDLFGLLSNDLFGLVGDEIFGVYLVVDQGRWRLRCLRSLRPKQPIEVVADLIP